MIILDTNVISQVLSAKGASPVRAWLSARAMQELYLCTPVIVELIYGAERIAHRQPSATLVARIEAMIAENFPSRVLPLDTQAALGAGRFRAKREALGRPVSIADSMIAGICLQNGAKLATRNIKDFDGLDMDLINPFEHIS